MNYKEINLNADKVSFWEFINNNIIIVPPYQREYVQGRRFGDVNKKRRDFIRDIHDALKNEVEKSLDFIYGGNENIDLNTKQSEDVFYPVDGQQRLTLLFLLHWYIFVRTKSYDCVERLSNFSYSTRTTSKSFCENLIKIRSKDSQEITDANTIDFSPEYRNQQLELQGRKVENADEIHEQEHDVLFEQIKNLPWFTGNMESDPTVSSMLIVLDCIHRFFCNESEEKLNAFKEILTKSDNISFLALDMNDALGSGPQIRDLYIKMNARGKQLSDFDDFKAELQKAKTGKNYDLLGDYLEQKPDCDRQEVIGKLNTDYSDLFFSIIDNSTIDDNPKFENALMNFFNEMIRTEFLISSKESELDQKAYRDFNSVIKAMSGHSFSCFIEESGESLLKDLKEKDYNKKTIIKNDKWALKGFEKCISVLDELLEHKDNFYITGAYDEEIINDLIKNLVSSQDNKSKNKDNIKRSAIFDYITKNNSWYSQDSFAFYCNFITRFIDNTEISNANEIAENLSSIRNMLDSLNGDYSKDSVIMAIARIKPYSFSSYARLQLEEEIIRAKLIKKDQEWESAFKKAESLTLTRQIWFLLELSSEGFMRDISDYLDGKLDTINPLFSTTKNGDILYEREDINIETFKRIVSKCNCFNNEKNWELINDIDPNLFETALLTVAGKRRYGQKMNNSVTDSFKLHSDDDRSYNHLFKHASFDSEQINYDFYQHIIGLYLLHCILSETSCVSNDTLRNYINNHTTDEFVEWKTILINSFLFQDSVESVSGFYFKRTYSALENKPYALVFDTENRRNDAMEIHSFYLATKLKSLGYNEIEVFPVKNYDDVSKGAYTSLDGFEFWNEENVFSLYGIDVNGVRITYIPNDNPGYYRELSNENPEFIQSFEMGNIEKIISIIEEATKNKGN